MTMTADVPSRTIQENPIHLLVVDDDKLNRLYLERLLSRYYNVTLAKNGEDALDAMQERMFDLVLLDIMMPGIDGLEVLRRMKQDQALSVIPVILVSAMIAPDDIAKGLEMGASDYVTKPIDMQVLIARITTQLKVKELSDAQRETIEKLREADKLRSQMTHIASHDLKNPLHNMRMAQHLLREEVDSDSSRVKQLLDNLEISLDTIYRVIEDYLDLVELKTDEITFKTESVWLWETVMNVIAQYQLAAENKNIDFNIGDLNSDVRADNARLEQAISNLVSNAIKYSPIGGTVRIWAEDSPNAGCVRLCFRDEGAGVPEDERHLLFTEFAKTSTRPTDGEASTGLGLWIVKHLLTRQGGDAGAIFPDEGGSIFWIDIPAAPAES